MNIESILKEIQRQSGHDTTSAVQKAEFIEQIKNVLLEDLLKVTPGECFRQNFSFLLETPIDFDTLTHEGTTGFTFDVSEDNPRLLINATEPLVYDALTPETLRGRWALVTTDGTRDMYLRRVQDVISGTDFGPPLQVFTGIVLDKALPAALTTDLHVMIFTLDYPIPGDTLQVESARIRDLHGNMYTLVAQQGPVIEDRWKLGRFIKSVPCYFGMGAHYQLQTPHETPEVSVESPNTARWGYEDDNTTENTDYGPAGEFSYCYVLVHGRRQADDVTYGTRRLLPMFMSAPSTPSEWVSTTWAAGAIRIDSANVSYIFNYDATDASDIDEASGYEKLWFRARRTVQNPATSSNHARVKRVWADGVYNYWRTTSAAVTTIYDTGASDPPDVRWPLADWHGQKSLRFDVLPIETRRVECVIQRRPATIATLADVPPLPPEADPLIVNRVLKRLYQRTNPGGIPMLDQDYKGLVRTYTAAVGPNQYESDGATLMQPNTPATGYYSAVPRFTFVQSG
jgi:hypothetical protein